MDPPAVDYDNASQSDMLLTGQPAEHERRNCRYSTGRSLWFLTMSCASVLCVVGIALLTIWQVKTSSGGGIVEDSDHRSTCERHAEDCRSNAPYIFDSTFSLLKQWPNSFSPNGHSLVAGIVPPNTRLYHAQRYPGAPHKPTYFAFDAEMSVGIYGQFGTNALVTMTNRKALNVIYVDGHSASLTTTGSLDSQFAILTGEVKQDPEYDQTYDENARASAWCEHLSDLKMDGIVRMNAGFEVMVCDYAVSGLQQISVTNMTVPGKDGSKKGDPKLPNDPNRQPPHGWGNIFAEQGSWEWLRSGTWHYGNQAGTGGMIKERRVILDLCRMITFYDPALQSLSGSHHGGIRGNDTYQNGWGFRRGHRLVGISQEDMAKVYDWNRKAYTVSDSKHLPCSGTDWQLVTETITLQHKARLREVARLLREAETSSDETPRLLGNVRSLIHAAIVSHWEYPEATGKSLAETRDAVKTRCSSAYSGHIELQFVNEFELVLKTAVEEVLQRLCSVEVDTFIWTEEHLNGQATPTPDLRSILTPIKSVLHDLGWDSWENCPRQCAEHELCYIPMWPIIYAPEMHQGGIYGGSVLSDDDMEAFWAPKCLSKADWDAWGTRAREPKYRFVDPPGYDEAAPSMMD